MDKNKQYEELGKYPSKQKQKSQTQKKNMSGREQEPIAGSSQSTGNLPKHGLGQPQVSSWSDLRQVVSKHDPSELKKMSSGQRQNKQSDKPDTGHTQPGLSQPQVSSWGDLRKVVSKHDPSELKKPNQRQNKQSGKSDAGQIQPGLVKPQVSSWSDLRKVVPKHDPSELKKTDQRQSKQSNKPDAGHIQPGLAQPQVSPWGDPRKVLSKHDPSELKKTDQRQNKQSGPGADHTQATLPSSGEQPMKKNRNKYPKQDDLATQQQAVTQLSVKPIPSQPISKDQLPSKPIHQQTMPLTQEIQEKLVITPVQSTSAATSSVPSASSKPPKRGKIGFQPLEVELGSCVGSRGQKLKIEANYLRIQLDQLVPKAYHYDIRFDPEKLPKKLLQDVVEKYRIKNFPKYFIAYDGQNSIYSANPLPIPGNVLKDELLWHDTQTNRERTITITVKEVDSCVIDLTAIKKYVCKSPGITKPLRAIQCLEIVLRMPFSGMFVNVNRSFFTRPNRTIDLGENYELWTGLYQSVVLGDVALFNIDVVNKPFPSARSVLDILTEVMNVNVNQALMRPEQLHENLKGLNLVYKQPGTSFSNIFKYNGLKDSAKTQTFMLENRKLTVEAYFKEKNIPLRYPHLPCLWCGPQIKNIYLPLEFCSIQDGQVVRKKLSENQIRSVIAETATSTDVRKRRIMDLLAKIRHNESKVVKEFGVNIGDKFTEVDARILSAPVLEYLTNPEVRVDRGVWNAEREKFLDGKKCTHWSVLKLDDRCPNSDIFRFADMISDLGAKANMSFAPKFTDLIEMRSNSRKHEIEQKMVALKRKNVELLFVIIPNRNEAYPNVKQAAELKCGILTQCIKSFTLARKLNGSTVYNILLKLNSKLNGLNHRVPQKCTPPIGRGKIMIVGADVTHPSGTLAEPSAVGVAASYDTNALRYNMCWRLQNPTQEMITDLKNIIVEQLNYYKKNMNGELPDKILYYRDGVSDGQFEDVLNIELSAIYAACQQIGPTYKPAVTFIVVQKRHNTRFYPGASRVSCGKNNNVMPGTIVDKFILDPRQYQFFLVSHAAIQGVAKPTKYCVIWDDSKIKADELQAFTYNLCHVFTRCNRSVSYVAPTYYAHLAAYRGKVYIQNERINMNNLEQEWNQRQIREDVSKGHPMFFV